MGAIPSTAFATRLRSLSYESFTAFVADLWEASGWESERSNHVLSVSNDTHTERLLVLPPGRFQRFRSVSTPAESVDRAVSPRRVETQSDLPRNTPDVPVIDAADIRRRLLYAVPGDVGDQLCQQALGVPLRAQRWKQAQRDRDGRSDNDTAPVSRRTTLGLLGLGTLGGLGLALRTQVDTQTATDAGLDGPTPDPDAALPPDVSFEFEYENSLLTIRHAGGDAIEASNLVIEGQGISGEAQRTLSETARYGPDDEMVAGDIVRLRFPADALVRLIWTDQRAQKHLGTFDGAPRRGESAFTVTASEPEASFDISFEEGYLTVRHTGGESLDSKRLLLHGSDFLGEPDLWWADTRTDNTTVSQGDSLQVEASEWYTLSLYWVQDNEAGLLEQSYGPGRPLKPSMSGLTGFAYDAGNTGFTSIQTGPVEKVTKAWTFDTGSPVGSSPAVVDGIVYAGNFDGTLFALDTADGSELWRFRASDRIGLSSPTVWDGVVYIGDEAGVFYALDAATGEQRWKYPDLENVASSPTLVTDGEIPTLFLTTFGGGKQGLVALDARTGAERFTAGDGRLNTTPAVGDELVYVGGTGGVYAFDRTDGIKRWQVGNLDRSFVESAPVVSDGTVYVGYVDGTLKALDATDGSQHWVSSVYGQIQASPTVAPVKRNGSVLPILLVGNTQTDTFRALRADDGTKLWRFTTGNTVTGAPTVAGSPTVESRREQTAYLPSFDGNIYAVDPADGSVRWTYRTDGQLFSSPAVVDGVVYVTSGDGRIYALTERDHPLIDPYWTQYRKGNTSGRRDS